MSKNIERLTKLVGTNIMTITGNLPYERLTVAIRLLCEEISSTDTDEFIWSTGEDICSLDAIIVGAYWHYSQSHNSMHFGEYKTLSALSSIYTPNMEIEPESGTMEADVYELLFQMSKSV